MAEHDERGEALVEAMWEAVARFGLLGLPVPEALGGAGRDLLSVAAAMEGLGYGCRDNGLIFSLNATGFLKHFLASS